MTDKDNEPSAEELRAHVYSYTAGFDIHTAGAPHEIDALFGKSEKRKRGRPKVMSEFFAWDLKFKHLNTDRGRQNIKYAYLAMGVLDIGPKGVGLPELGWMVDWDAADQNRKGAIKWGILTELGRLAEVAVPEAVRQYAGIICEWKPDTKRGIAFLRRQRLEAISKRDDFKVWQASKRDDDLLFNRLAGVMNQYRAEHPEITLAELFAVVDRLHADLAMRAG